MAIHFTVLAWRTAWTKEPGRLQSMGLQRGRHNLGINNNFFKVVQQKIVEQRRLRILG